MINLTLALLGVSFHLSLVSVLFIWFQYSETPRDGRWGQTWSETYQHMREISKLELLQPVSSGKSQNFSINVIVTEGSTTLQNTLHSLDKVHLGNTSATLDIWFDLNEDTLKVDVEILKQASDFRWKYGEFIIHVPSDHMGSYNQWMMTWRPTDVANDIALLTRDDIITPPYAYTVLTSMVKKYSQRSDICAYCPYDLKQPSKSLKSSNSASLQNHMTLASGFYPVSFSPHPRTWMRFQDWMKSELPNIKLGVIKPYIDNDHKSTMLYKILETEHRETEMWYIWFEYFCHTNQLLSVWIDSDLQGT